jgi:hypothetical protein
VRVLTLAVALCATAAAQEPRRVVPGAAASAAPAYRQVQQGEAQVEGLLLRVECPPGRPVAFAVKVKDRVTKFQAARLEAVEYIAHTPDFKGPMTCGGRMPGDPVLVTTKSASPTPRVVAVEFLPRK